MPLGLPPLLSLLPLLSSPSLPDPIDIEGIWAYAKKDGSIAYEGEVVVRYQGTKIVADRVTIFNEEERGVAEGHVVLIDPDGTAHADRLEFIWKKGLESGNADNVTMRVTNTTLRARHAVFHPGEWTLTDVEGTTCLRPTPVYLVTSDKVVVRPGQDLYAHQPRISLFGHFVGELPSENISLTPAVAGLHYPALGYKVGRGVGATWAGGVQAGKDSVLSFSARTFQQRKPSASLLYTQTFLPLKKATEIVTPRSDFGERFNYGFMDSVAVDSPDQERKYLNAARSSLSFGGQANGAISDRDRGTRYSKLELIYERGTVAGRYGFLGQARLQDIRREDEGFKTRLSLSGSMELPSHVLSPGLSTLARLDSQAFLGSTAYGWGRGSAGLTYSPAPWLRLSSAAFFSAETGEPEFGMDPLYAKGGFLSRADIAVGGLKVSFLAKNDRRQGFYDRELAVRQVIGCFEAFYLRRQHPLDSRIGLTLRIQPLIDTFRRRSVPPQTPKSKAP